jgi:hypothetical protein
LPQLTAAVSPSAARNQQLEPLGLSEVLRSAGPHRVRLQWIPARIELGFGPSGADRITLLTSLSPPQGPLGEAGNGWQEGGKQGRLVESEQ